jgi:hypothetical protein
MQAGTEQGFGRTLWPLLLIPVMFGVAAVSLRAEGRLWICSCGDIKIWVGQICSSNNSQHIFDPYSFTHLLHGFLFFWLIAWFLSRLRPDWQITLAVALEASWEILENTNFVIERYRTATAALGYNGDTVVNSMGDLFCSLLGFLLARQLGFRKSIVVFLVLEFVLILWIRDSLLLEILMLLVPVDLIRSWQICS